MRVSFALSRLGCCALLSGCAASSTGAYDGNYGVPFDGGPDGGSVVSAPEPTVLASGLGAPLGIALIGSTVYAADPEMGDIVAVPLDGGAVTALASGLGTPTWLATDGTQIFASDVGGGRVLAITTQGEVLQLATGQASPGRIRVADGVVYWIDEGKSDGSGGITDGTGALVSISVSGGNAKTLASRLNTPHDFVTGAAPGILFSEMGPAPICATPATQTQANAQIANWEQIQREALIRAIPIGGGTPTTFPQQAPPFLETQLGPSNPNSAQEQCCYDDTCGKNTSSWCVEYATLTGAGQVHGLALDPSGQNLFFTTREMCWPVAGNVYWTTIGGASTLTTLSDAPPVSDRIEASAAAVTWASQALLSQVAWPGPAPYRNLAPNTHPGDFLWDGATFYWTDEEAGQVLMLTSQ